MNETRRKRWLAFLLGDAPEEEREAIQTELGQVPEEAGLLRHVIDETTGWAKGPIPYAPLELGFLESAAQDVAKMSGHGTRFSWRKWALAAAAVALLAFATYEAQVSVTIGNVSFCWGQAPAVNDTASSNKALSLLSAQVYDLARASEAAAAQIQRLSYENTELHRQIETAAVRLAYSQRADTAALSRDIQGLLYLAGGLTQQNNVPSGTQ